MAPFPHAPLFEATTLQTIVVAVRWYPCRHVTSRRVLAVLSLFDFLEAAFAIATASSEVSAFSITLAR
jgi:hypothetical protein